VSNGYGPTGIARWAIKLRQRFCAEGVSGAIIPAKLASKGAGNRARIPNAEMQGCDMFCPPLTARFTVGTIR
jgi:hypothetical protein